MQQCMRQEQQNKGKPTGFAAYAYTQEAFLNFL